MDNKFKKRIVTFPRMGKEYTLIFQKILEDLGFEVVAPFPNSEKTIKFGVKHSSDMMCFPYKVTLGNFKEALERGVNTLVMWDSRGRCRFRHYWRIQEQTLKDLGYKFEICSLNLNFFSSLNFRRFIHSNFSSSPKRTALINFITGPRGARSPPSMFS